jgi:phage terminase small subunit
MPPKPTPTATLAARGSWRANTREGEPKPPVLDTAEPPAELTMRAAEIWAALAPRLVATGVLTTSDVYSFARYCRLLAVWEKVMTQFEESTDRSTVLTLAKLSKIIADLEGNFGLTPSDRTALKVESPKPENDKERFFRKAG